VDKHDEVFEAVTVLVIEAKTQFYQMDKLYSSGFLDYYGL